MEPDPDPRAWLADVLARSPVIRRRASTNSCPGTGSGRPFLHSLAREFRFTRTEVGLLNEMQSRDLRPTGMTRLAEAGPSMPQIAAISGHSIEHTQKIPERDP